MMGEEEMGVRRGIRALTKPTTRVIKKTPRIQYSYKYKCDGGGGASDGWR